VAAAVSFTIVFLCFSAFMVILTYPFLLPLHGCRCDWVRQLMLRSAWFHSTLRELPPVCFGTLLLHLPACWQRLAFLAESQQEMGCEVMWAVQCRAGEFASKFPEFAKWTAYGEQPAAVLVSGGPWVWKGMGGDRAGHGILRLFCNQLAYV
jgi:hypothetical protein